MAEHELTMDGQTFVVRVDGDDVRVGRRGSGDEPDWYPETVPLSSLPGGLDNETSLRGVVSAIVERGG